MPKHTKTKGGMKMKRGGMSTKGGMKMKKGGMSKKGYAKGGMMKKK